MSDNKLVETIMDAAVLSGFAAGIVWFFYECLKDEPDKED